MRLPTFYELFLIPNWGSDISDTYTMGYFESGRLEEGDYCVDALMTVELETVVGVDWSGGILYMWFYMTIWQWLFDKIVNVYREMFNKWILFPKKVDCTKILIPLILIL